MDVLVNLSSFALCRIVWKQAKLKRAYVQHLHAANPNQNLSTPSPVMPKFTSVAQSFHQEELDGPYYPQYPPSLSPLSPVLPVDESTQLHCKELRNLELAVVDLLAISSGLLVVTIPWCGILVWQLIKRTQGNDQSWAR